VRWRSSAQKAAERPQFAGSPLRLLEQDQLPNSAGSRFARVIIGVIIIDVLAMILASVPEFDARFGMLFTAVKIGAVMVFALEYAARLWSVAGHSPRKLSPVQDRIEYALSSLGIIDLLAFLPASIALIAGQRSLLVLFGVLPFFKLGALFAGDAFAARRTSCRAANAGRLPGDPDRRGAGVRLAALCDRA
jgi:voltage-gated potassium channel